MHRFFLPANRCHGSIWSLADSDAHHAATVLRLRAGDPVVVLDGAGGIHDCHIESVHKRAVTVAPDRTTSVPKPDASVTLVQAIAKPKAMEWILQKSVELGVDRISPILSDRCVSRPDSSESDDKQDRWQSICIEALKQCGGAWLTLVDPPRTLGAWLTEHPPCDLVLLASLDATAMHPGLAIAQGLGNTPRSAGRVAVVIGPEGDLTAEESKELVRCGALPITLGQRVLRSETAALAALAVIQHELTLPATGNLRRG